jgi:hypothetical protein
MRYDINGTYRAVSDHGTVTINRSGLAPISSADLDARIKKGKFRAKQFKEAVANLERLKNTQPRRVPQYVVEDVVRLG